MWVRVSYIVENVDADVIREMPEEGLGKILWVIFNTGSLRGLKHFVRNVLDGLHFKDELLASLANASHFRRELLRFVFEEVDTEVLVGKSPRPRRLFSSGLFGDICIEIAEKENADFNTVWKAHDWIFLSRWWPRIYYLLLGLLDHTYHRFAFLMQEFLRQESLYVPSDMYRGLVKFCPDLGKGQRHSQLESGLREAGLLVEGDALDGDRIALLVKKNPLNRAIIDPSCRDGIPKGFNNGAFKDTYEQLNKAAEENDTAEVHCSCGNFVDDRPERTAEDSASICCRF
jgi:hypothetical protein